MPRRLFRREVPNARDRVEGRAGNRLLEAFANPDRNDTIVLSPDDRRWNANAVELIAELARFVGREGAHVSDQRVASISVREWTQVVVEGVRDPCRIAVAPPKFASQSSDERRGRKKSRKRKTRARDASLDRWPSVECDAVDEAEMGNARRVANGDRLCDAAANAVSHDARALDAELIEHRDDAFRMGADVDGAIEWAVAASVAEQVSDDEPMARRHERYDVAPQMAGGRKAVQEDDWFAGAPRAGGVVVDARAGEVEEFTAHEMGRVALGAGR